MANQAAGSHLVGVGQEALTGTLPASPSNTSWPDGAMLVDQEGLACTKTPPGVS